MNPRVNRVPNSVKEAEKAILQKTMYTQAMRSSMQTAPQSEQPPSSKASKQHARASSVLDTIQPTASNALEMDPVTATAMRDTKALKFMHKLRHDTFDKRCAENRNSVKPYLPMLISDEKELIDEQFEASKK